MALGDCPECSSRRRLEAALELLIATVSSGRALSRCALPRRETLRTVANMGDRRCYIPEDQLLQLLDQRFEEDRGAIDKLYLTITRQRAPARMKTDQKLTALLERLKNLCAEEHSGWYRVHPLEALAAFFFVSSPKAASRLFSGRAKERILRHP